MRLDFYVVSNFGLSSDDLLGLSAMKSERMIVIPDRNVIRYQRKSFWAMGSPRSLASSDGEIVPTQTVPTVQDFPAEQGQRTLTNSRSKSRDEVVERHLDSSGTSEQSLDQGKWTVVKATIIGSHVIPDRTAMHVPVSI